MRCDEYDPEKISGIIKEGTEALCVKPSGRILFKPKVVIAHPEIFPHAFTRKEFFGWRYIGHQRAGSDLCSEARYAMRFLVNLPKFKAHPWTRLTLRLKNLIGIQDDRHRLVDHNTFLGHKIADLQEAMHIFKAFSPSMEKQMERVRYVVGRLQGLLELDEGERLIFAGNCTSWEETIDGQGVNIESNYKTTHEVDATKTKSSDMLLKMLSSIWQMFQAEAIKIYPDKGMSRVRRAAHKLFIVHWKDRQCQFRSQGAHPH